jgi:hypothetical protein
VLKSACGDAVWQVDFDESSHRSMSYTGNSAVNRLVFTNVLTKTENDGLT